MSFPSVCFRSIVAPQGNRRLAQVMHGRAGHLLLRARGLPVARPRPVQPGHCRHAGEGFHGAPHPREVVNLSGMHHGLPRCGRRSGDGKPAEFGEGLEGTWAPVLPLREEVRRELAQVLYNDGLAGLNGADSEYFALLHRDGFRPGAEYSPMRRTMTASSPCLTRMWAEVRATGLLLEGLEDDVHRLVGRRSWRCGPRRRSARRRAVPRPRGSLRQCPPRLLGRRGAVGCPPL